MKILSRFDDFFVEPYKLSTMTRFTGISLSMDRFRKDKIFITKADIKKYGLLEE